MPDHLIEQHVDVIQVRWICACGGEYRRLGQAFKTIAPSSILATRGYSVMIYPHQCDKCMVIVDNKNSYPRLVVKGDPKDV